MTQILANRKISCTDAYETQPKLAESLRFRRLAPTMQSSLELLFSENSLLNNSSSDFGKGDLHMSPIGSATFLIIWYFLRESF